MRQTRKKRRSRGSKKGNAECGNEQIVLKNLLEAFSSVSMEEAASAYKEANGDPNKAAEILAKNAVVEDQSTICSSSIGNENNDVGSTSSTSTSNGNYDVGSSLSSNSSQVSGDANCLLQDEFKRKSKPKLNKIIASAGTVSTVLGKDYVRSTHMKGSAKLKGFNEENWRVEAEQFLCSMLGHDCELSLGVVSDVLCQCGYNVNKALDILLELSASTKDQSHGSTSKEDTQQILESTDSLTDRTSNATSHSSDIEMQENIWFTGNLSRNCSKISQSTESHHSIQGENFGSEISQKVLESLFNMPPPNSAEYEPSSMNWRDVVKKMTSLGPKIEPVVNEREHLVAAKGDEYQVHRETSQQHWNSMKSYYQKAATAFANGEKEHAAYLSEQGRLQSKLARDADERASQDIFAARNKTIENVITIDLHGQHIKPAMKLLKLHLLFGALVRSVQSFRVITGCGSHGLGKSKLKNSVTNLLQKEGIAWSEENRGTLFIRLNGRTDFSFLDSCSDYDSD